MEEVEYWKRRATAAADEYDELIAVHRTQNDALRRQCADLLHERSLMKAATASDVRTFILNYQADVLRRTGGARTSAADAVPISKMLQFLHEYSNGLVPAPRNERKRDREVDSATASPAIGVGSSSSGVTPQRLYQRLMLRRRQNLRECEMEEWIQQQQQLLAQSGAGPLSGVELDGASSPASLCSPQLVQQPDCGAEEIAAELEREELEQQRKDERHHKVRSSEGALISAGGAHPQERSKRGHWPSTHGWKDGASH